jgi:hypothetical protein
MPWSIEIAAAVTFFDSPLASQQTASAMCSSSAARAGRNAAIVGHSDGMCAALAAGSSSDECDLALEPPAHFCAALTRFDPMINRWISLVPSYKRSSRTSR